MLDDNMIQTRSFAGTFSFEHSLRVMASTFYEQMNFLQNKPQSN